MINYLTAWVSPKHLFMNSLIFNRIVFFPNVSIPLVTYFIPATLCCKESFFPMQLSHYPCSIISHCKRTSRLTLLLILVVCPEVFAFTVLRPWTFLGVSSSVRGKFFSRLSPRMDLQSLGEGLLIFAREHLFSSATVDEASR